MKSSAQSVTRRVTKGNWIKPTNFSMDTNRPLIGVVVSQSDVLGSLPQTEAICQNVEKGLQLAGGLPFRFNLLNISSGTTKKHPELSSRLSIRDILADQLECVSLDLGVAGLILMADNNEAAAGLILGASRLNLPSIYMPLRGSSLQSSPQPKSAKSTSSSKGKDSEEGDYPKHAVDFIAEVMGLSMPYSSSISSGSPDQYKLAQETGERIVHLVRQNFSLRRVLMPNSFLNAIRADASMGGWSGTVVFLTALAREVGANLSIENFEKIGRSTPQICSLSGAKSHRLAEFHEVGGVPSLFAALRGSWLPCPSVSGKSANELAKSTRLKSNNILRMRSPYRKEGGVIFLKGNLAPKGAILEMSSETPLKMFPFTGPARVFDSKEDAIKSVEKKKINSGEVIVVRYEGPKGGPGLRSLAPLGKILTEQGLSKDVLVITDGLWRNGSSSVPAVEMISPEAMEGSPLSILKDGDKVCVDLAQRSLSVQLTEMDMKLRWVRWKAPESRAQNGYWARYARSVSSALEGAVLK